MIRPPVIDGHQYRIWASGRVDGFGSGRIQVINRIPLLEMLAAQNALKQRDRASKPE